MSIRSVHDRFARFHNPLAAACALSFGVMVTPPAADARVVDCVAAQVNNEIITVSEVKARRKAVLDDLYRMRLDEADMQKQMEKARTELVPSLIEERLMLQKATDLGLEVSSAEGDRIVASIMEQNNIPDEDALERTLEAEGMTLAQLRGNIERRSIIEKLKQFEIASKVVVTDEEAERFYEAHKGDFREPERVRLRELVLLTESRDEAEVREEVEELANLARNGADFAELATLFSHAPSAEHGGDLGLREVTELSADIAAAAAKLRAGDISAPIKSRFGFHILKLIERKEVAFKDLEAARPDIQGRIQQAQFDEKIDSYVDKLKENSFIRVNEACLAGVN